MIILHNGAHVPPSQHYPNRTLRITVQELKYKYKPIKQKAARTTTAELLFLVCVSVPYHFMAGTTTLVQYGAVLQGSTNE